MDSIVDCGVLRTINSEEARRHNADWLDNPDWPALGIEVTDPNLAARCVLGNIDPQHKPGGRSSAIEEALHAPLPQIPRYSLVTIRKDRDAIGAMAIIMLLIHGLGSQILKTLVAWLGALDQMGFDNASADHPQLFQAVEQDEYMRLAVQALNVITKNNDRWPLMNDKVTEFAYILSGQVTLEHLDKIISHRPVRVLSDYRKQVEMFGRVAFLEVLGEYDAARDWANRHHEVGIIFDPVRRTESGGTQARWSVIRQVRPVKVFDRYGFEKAINDAESEARGLTLQELQAQSLTWGGPANIVTSPQGEGNGTFIPRKKILELVRAHLESGIVS